MSQIRYKRVTLMVPKEMYEAIEGKNKSDIIRRALAHFLGIQEVIVRRGRPREQTWEGAA